MMRYFKTELAICKKTQSSCLPHWVDLEKGRNGSEAVEVDHRCLLLLVCSCVSLCTHLCVHMRTSECCCRQRTEDGASCGEQILCRWCWFMQALGQRTQRHLRDGFSLLLLSLHPGLLLFSNLHFSKLISISSKHPDEDSKGIMPSANSQLKRYYVSPVAPPTKFCIGLVPFVNSQARFT